MLYMSGCLSVRSFGADRTDVRSRQDVMGLEIPFPYGRMPDDFARMMRRAYLAAIAYTDDQVRFLCLLNIRAADA